VGLVIWERRVVKRRLVSLLWKERYSLEESMTLELLVC